MTNDLNAYYDNDGLIRLLKSIRGADTKFRPTLEVVAPSDNENAAVMERSLLSALRQAS